MGEDQRPSVVDQRGDVAGEGDQPDECSLEGGRKDNVRKILQRDISQFGVRKRRAQLNQSMAKSKRRERETTDAKATDSWCRRAT